MSRCFRATAAGMITCALVLGVVSGASAASKGDEKAYKAFLAQMSKVQQQISAVKQAALAPDASALDAPCAELGRVIATAQGTKRPKLVKAAVWSHVQSGYAHYKTAAEDCVKHAPGTTYFADAIHELKLGNEEIRQVQAALHL